MNHSRTYVLAFLLLLSGFVAVGQPSRFKITYSYNSSAEWAKSVVFRPDSTLLINAMFSPPAGSGVLLINVGQNGNIISSKTHSRANRGYSGSWAGSLLSIDSNYYVGGEYHIPNMIDPNNNYAFPSLVKFDYNGDTVWAKHYDFDTSAYYQASVCRATANGEILLVGSVAQHENFPGKYDYYVIRLDTSGNIIWKKTYGSPGVSEKGTTINELQDGRLLISGVSINANNTAGFPWVIITDALGNMEWQKYYLHPAMSGGIGGTMPSRTGGFILLGMADTLINANDHPINGYIARVNSSGDVRWKRIFNSRGFTSIWDFYELDNGDIVFSGEQDDTLTGKKVGFIALVDSNSNTRWWRTYYELINGPHFLSCVRPAPDGGFVAVGSTFSVTTPISQDAWIIKTDSLGCVVSNCHLAVDEIPKQSNKLTCYPSPADQHLNIKSDEKGLIKVFDLMGREILRTESDGHVQVNTSNWVNGTYIITLQTRQGSILKSKVVVKH